MHVYCLIFDSPDVRDSNSIAFASWPSRMRGSNLFLLGIMMILSNKLSIEIICNKLKLFPAAPSLSLLRSPCALFQVVSRCGDFFVVSKDFFSLTSHKNKIKYDYKNFYFSASPETLRNLFWHENFNLKFHRGNEIPIKCLRPIKGLTFWKHKKILFSIKLERL